MSDYLRGQRNALNAAMMALCPHCLTLSSSREASNDPLRDGHWHGGEPRSCIHIIDGKRRVCRAAKLIPLRSVMEATLR